jgi:hypothetical protein
MLSRWRKQVRDGELVGKAPALDTSSVAELQRLREMEKQFKRLHMEHDAALSALKPDDRVVRRSGARRSSLRYAMRVLQTFPKASQSGSQHTLVTSFQKLHLGYTLQPTNNRGREIRCSGLVSLSPWRFRLGPAPA